MTDKKIFSEILKKLEENEVTPRLLNEQIKLYQTLTAQKNLISLQKKWQKAASEKLIDPEKNLLAAVLMELARQNEEYRRQLQETTDAYEDVVGLITHEFKNILTSVHGYNMILEHQLAAREDVSLYKNLQASDRLTQQLFDMADSLLKMSLSEKGLLKPEYKLINFVEDIIQPIRSDLAGEQKEKRMTITIDIPHGDPLIEGDDGLLDLVMRNLLINALKYGKKGSTITVKVERKNKFLQVGVKNACESLPANFCKDIFQKFKTKEIGDVKGGSGIGLYNVKKIVTLHGGEISCKVEKKKWVHFEFKIPQNIF